MTQNIKEQHSHNILFLGYGYIAQYFCRTYHLDSFDIGASINKTKEKYFKTPSNVKTIRFSEINSSVLDNYDNFVISIPPFYQLKTDIIIDKFHDYFLSRKTPYKLIYLSATSVYGDHEGKEVQEDSELKAQSSNGIARIACENKYLELQENELANILILRLSGIYGDKRNSILTICNKEITQNKSSNRMISRTHVADIIAIIREIILLSKIKNQIFNISDNNPCPTNEVNNFNKENLPKPNDENIKIENIENQKFITITFSGRSSDDNFKEYQEILVKKIKEENIKADLENPIRAYYNHPWTLPFLKRNEILFELN